MMHLSVTPCSDPCRNYRNLPSLFSVICYLLLNFPSLGLNRSKQRKLSGERKTCYAIMFPMLPPLPPVKVLI